MGMDVGVVGCLPPLYTILRYTWGALEGGLLRK